MRAGAVYYNEHDAGAAAWLAELVDEGLIPHGPIDTRDIRDVRANDVRGYAQCHFFAGIAGWPLALQLAGWGDRPVWTGSCPCQPFSSAGKRQGAKDERHLWPEFHRLIRECRPQTIFGEQVASSEVVGSQLEAAFVIAVQRGDYARANKLARRLAQSPSFHYWRRWVDGVRADLEAEDYAFRAGVLGAHSVGSPNIRQRLFWLADTQDPGRQARGVECIASPARPLQSDEPGAAVRLGNSGSEGLAGRTGQQGDDGTQRPTAERASGPWSDFALIPCRDGKTRRIPAGSESVLQRMADGLSAGMDDLRRAGFPLCQAFTGRSGLLKGYGNAINPYTAADFVMAYLLGGLT